MSESCQCWFLRFAICRDCCICWWQCWYCSYVLACWLRSCCFRPSLWCFVPAVSFARYLDDWFKSESYSNYWKLSFDQKTFYLGTFQMSAPSFGYWCHFARACFSFVVWCLHSRRISGWSSTCFSYATFGGILDTLCSVWHGVDSLGSCSERSTCFSNGSLVWIWVARMTCHLSSTLMSHLRDSVDPWCYQE